MKRYFMAALLLLSQILFMTPAFSHCQIPCGIYDDDMRFDTISENIKTIEKSMNEIISLSKEENKNFNQIVRWVDNKEEHADKIIDIVSDYFLAQRVKPVEEENEKLYATYVQEVTLLHKMLVYSMKAKQTTDLENVEKLKTLLEQFRHAYAVAKSYQEK